ncbi:MAG TPA: site-specific integrase [Gammaproteobacteria bacterium]|nr:site-specific integrase [Gammaproteobacteria bacterium]
MANIEKRPQGYRVRVRLKGQPPQSATFQRLTDARKWAQATEAAIREGRHFQRAEAKKHTVADLVARFARDVAPRKGSGGAKYSRQLAWWSERIGAYTLADLTPALIAEQRDALSRATTSRGTATTPATVNRYLAALSVACNIAVKEWGWIDHNPLSKVAKLKEPRGRVRFLSDDERERLLTACRESESKDLYPAVVLALSTGARRMEILGARWPQVDFARATLTLEETKNGERRVLPLAGLALDLMRERAKIRRIDSDLVFPGTSGKKPIDLRHAFDKALERAKIEDFRWHDLRHSAASYLAMNGATLAEIAEVLGHKTLQMVKRYAHLSEAHTAAVVGKMNDRIFGGV